MVRGLIPFFAVLLASMVLFVLPIEVPQTLSVPGKLLPVRSWEVTRSADGTLESVLHDYRTGTTNAYGLHRFERGDVVQYQLHPTLGQQQQIAMGDTVATLYSSETDRLMTQLSGSIATTKARLSVEASGEKEAVIQEATMAVQLAEEHVVQQTNIVERLRMLRARDMVPEQELEIAESTLRVRQAEVALAQAHLTNVQSGAKPEQLMFNRSEVQAFEEELSALAARQSLFTLIAPLDGVLTQRWGRDTLLTVQDRSAFVVLMPVSWQSRDLLHADQPITLQVDQDTTHAKATLLQTGDTIYPLHDEQVVLTTLLLDDPPEGWLPGMMVTGTLTQPPLSLWEYLKMLFQET